MQFRFGLVFLAILAILARNLAFPGAGRQNEKAKPIFGGGPGGQPHMKRAGSATDPLWYKDAVIYELHVKAFLDSNNDGIGDLCGLVQKLDYIQDLGVTCVWLLPFFPSPLRDDGYDIADYMDVHPSYGTIEDFKQFLDAPHQRNMQVMIELVINHTSDQHP